MRGACVWDGQQSLTNCMDPILQDLPWSLLPVECRRYLQPSEDGGFWLYGIRNRHK